MLGNKPSAGRPKPRPKLCFCEANEWGGGGPLVTVTYRTRARAVKHGWADTRRVSGYLETCERCGDRAVVNEDGDALRFLRDTDAVARKGV